MNLNTLCKYLVLPAVLLAGAAPATAAAEEWGRTIAVPVSAGDLDLSRPHDRAELDNRIRRAARRVCGHIDMRQASWEARCADTAVDRSRAQRDALVARATQQRIVFAPLSAVPADGDNDLRTPPSDMIN